MTDGVNPKQPIRRLVAAGCLTDHYLSTTSAAVSTTRGMWRCTAGHRPQLDSSGAVLRRGLATIDGVQRDPLGRIEARPGCGSAVASEGVGNLNPATRNFSVILPYLPVTLSRQLPFN